MGKPLDKDLSDGNTRKLREQKGLDTPVVSAVNDVD